MGIEEERNARREFIYFETSRDGCFDISDSISQSEGHFLHGGGSCFANVIAADRDRVPLRNFARAKSERVRYQTQRGARRINVGPAGDVFLQNVVLNCPAKLVEFYAILFRHRQIETKQR